MKKTAKLTIETQRVWVISGRRRSRQLRCEACGEVVHFVTAPEAAALAATSQRTIYRLVEAGKLHFTETAEDLLICFNSLCHSLFTAGEGSRTDKSNWQGDKYESDE